MRVIPLISPTWMSPSTPTSTTMMMMMEEETSNVVLTLLDFLPNSKHSACSVQGQTEDELEVLLSMLRGRLMTSHSPHAHVWKMKILERSLYRRTLPDMQDQLSSISPESSFMMPLNDYWNDPTCKALHLICSKLERKIQTIQKRDSNVQPNFMSDTPLNRCVQEWCEEQVSRVKEQSAFERPSIFISNHQWLVSFLKQTLCKSGFMECNFNISKRHVSPTKSDYLRIQLVILVESDENNNLKDSKQQLGSHHTFYPLKVYIQYAKFLLEWNRDGFIHCHDMNSFNRAENLAERILLRKTLMISRDSETSRTVINTICSFCTRWNSSMEYDERRCNSGHFGLSFMYEIQFLQQQLFLMKIDQGEDITKSTDGPMDELFDTLLECVALRKELPLRFPIPLDLFLIIDLEKALMEFDESMQMNEGCKPSSVANENRLVSFTISTTDQNVLEFQSMTSNHQPWRERLKKLARNVLYGQDEGNEYGLPCILSVSRDYSEITSFYKFVQFLLTRKGKQHFLVDEFLCLLQLMIGVLLTNRYEQCSWCGSIPSQRETWIQGMELNETMLNEYKQLIERQIRAKQEFTIKPILYNVKEWYSIQEEMQIEDVGVLELIQNYVFNLFNTIHRFDK
ncbi:hypothetical protein C9374_004700 [Naegleria lovaniensis]|uniref:Uncharacterized protein n=1 Tax=Naegleria lovaniensis TaxID=51637 RepID=A0AA88GRZ2_NAELO|nr:uncharacterized protein C9374_004700 [Naegleria lovaniensis]KAG2383363.1 hypothetical protein C9374_004700 [Naegleria lovaniensis]